MTIGKVHLTNRYARYRIKSPKAFISSSLRTHDIGRAGHTKRIAGRLKTTGKWETQAILISRQDYNKGKRLKNVGFKTYKHQNRKKRIAKHKETMRNLFDIRL